MNNLLRLTGDFLTARASRPGAITLPAGATVETSKIRAIRESLEHSLAAWPANAVIDGVLVSVEYRQIVAKSNRIGRMLYEGRDRTPETTIRGARYLDFYSSHPRHVMTHHVSKETIYNTIRELAECEAIVARHFNGQMTAAKMEELTKKPLKSNWNKTVSATLRRSHFAQLVRDAFYVNKFYIEKPPSERSSDSIVTIFNTGKPTREILDELGLDISSSSILDNSILMTETEYRELIDRAPYLVAMACRDLSEMPPMQEGSVKPQQVSTLPEKPSDEPTIGVIDTPFDQRHEMYFSNWVDYRPFISDEIPLNDSDFCHGTCVSSLIVDPKTGNPALDDHCGYFRVRHFGVAPASAFSSFEVMKKIEKIVASNLDIKVWNISLGSIGEVSPNSISPEAAVLDKLQQQYDVLFVVAGTNQVNGIPERVGSPADSINALVVNAVNRNAAPASYTRKGPILSFHHKPDVSYYGGDNGDPLWACCSTGAKAVAGTSFAAPLVARKAAYLIYKMHISCELAKALLIDAACAWTAPQDIDRLGYGIVPIEIEKILETPNDEIRFMLSGVATERETFNYRIPIPVSEATHPSVARITLCYFPPCNRNQGVDYTCTELDIHFGRLESSGRIKPIKPNDQGEDTCRTTEEKARKSLRKWDNVKHVSEKLDNRSKPRKAYDNPLWGLMIRKSSRYQSGSHEPQRFGVVATIHNLKGENRFDTFVRQCSAQGWMVERVQIDNELKIYETSQVEVKFEENSTQKASEHGNQGIRQ